MNIYLDDIREPPLFDRDINSSTYNEHMNWRVFRTASECIEFINENLNSITLISFDHDLGNDENGTGYDVAKYLEKLAFEGKIEKEFDYRIHSANPIGAKNIDDCMKNTIKYIKKNLKK